MVSFESGSTFVGERRKEFRGLWFDGQGSVHFTESQHAFWSGMH